MPRPLDAQLLALSQLLERKERSVQALRLQVGALHELRLEERVLLRHSTELQRSLEAATKAAGRPRPQEPRAPVVSTPRTPRHTAAHIDAASRDAEGRWAAIHEQLSGLAPLLPGLEASFSSCMDAAEARREAERGAAALAERGAEAMQRRVDAAKLELQRLRAEAAAPGGGSGGGARSGGGGGGEEGGGGGEPSAGLEEQSGKLAVLHDEVSELSASQTQLLAEVERLRKVTKAAAKPAE